jgi:hypothetical protein
MYAAATYDFGILKAYAGYINRKIESSFNSNVFLKRSAQQVGVQQISIDQSGLYILQVRLLNKEVLRSKVVVE